MRELVAQHDDEAEERLGKESLFCAIFDDDGIASSEYAPRDVQWIPELNESTGSGCERVGPSCGGDRVIAST